MRIYALTHRGKSIENVLKTDVTIKNTITGEEIKSLAIWDTGATNSVITKSAAAQLGLKAISMAKVKGVHGEKEVNVYETTITLNLQDISIKTRVTECSELSDKQDTAMLIGMDIISLGDLCISNYEGKTTLTFRVPSLATTDYVKEIDEHNKYQKIHETMVSKKIEDKCGCGSGKLYKNCHGKSVYNQ